MAVVIDADCVFVQTTWGMGEDVTVSFYETNPTVHPDVEPIAYLDLKANQAIRLGELITKCGKVAQETENGFLLQSLLLPTPTAEEGEPF